MNSGSLRSAGVIGPLLAGSAIAQTQSQPQPWRYNAGTDLRTARVGALYTSALTALYAQGFHHVHGISLQDGEIRAMALNNQDRLTLVTVDPGTGQVSLG